MRRGAILRVLKGFQTTMSTRWAAISHGCHLSVQKQTTLTFLSAFPLRASVGHASDTPRSVSVEAFGAED